MIITNNIKAREDIITADSVNIIQTGLDQIVSTWGLNSRGKQLAVKGEYCRASLINTWSSWLKFYSERIGATSVTNLINNIEMGEPMLYSEIQDIYDKAMQVKNWCNRSECNKSECNYSSESQSGESSNHECNNTEW